MILPQLDAVAELLRHAWNDPAFKGPVELKWQQANVTGQVVSYAPGPAGPRSAAAGFFGDLLLRRRDRPCPGCLDALHHGRAPRRSRLLRRRGKLSF